MANVPGKTAIGESPDNKTVIKLDRIDELLKAHEAKREKTARNEVSDDFMTVEEISLARGMSKSTVREWLKRCVKVGLVKIGMKRMPRIGGGTYPVAAYRFNDSAKEMK